jgi:hypothetical protein
MAIDTDAGKENVLVRCDPDELIHYAIQSLGMVKGLTASKDFSSLVQSPSFKDGLFFLIECITESLKIARDSYQVELEKLQEKLHTKE